MSTKSQKSKKKQEKEIKNTNENELSPKEIYDMNKEKRLKEKKKKESTPSKKKKKKTYETNLAGRIFAIIMLILMIASVFGYIISYFR